MYCRKVDPLKTDENDTYSVVAVPCLEDNYAYLLIDKASKTCAAFDPVEPAKVLAAAEAEGVTISHVLTTHHHWDHAGGNNEIKGLVPGIKVVGSAVDNVEGCTDPCNDNDTIEIGSLSVKCLVIPGHTLGSVCYYLANDGGGAVFTGDVLFVAGCGRIMEGDPQGMWDGIASKLLPLPDATKVFVGHEYTITNLSFSLSVDPDNAELKKMMEFCRDQSLSKGVSVPTTMEWERAANPFVNTSSPTLMAVCGCSEPVDVFASMRERKNSFKPPAGL